MTSPTTVLALLVVIAALASLVIAFIGGTLLRHNGSTWPMVFFTGGGVFAAAMTLILKTMEVLGHS